MFSRLSSFSRHRCRIAALTVGVALLAASAGVAAAATSTHASFYTPFSKSGKPVAKVTETVSGVCGDSSMLVPHKDAWACVSGTTKHPKKGYDACFSFTAKSRSVLCLSKTGPWSSLLEIKLTASLPTKYANKRTLRHTAWAVETSSHLKCLLNTGSTGVVDGKTLQFFCPGSKQDLWGLSRKTKQWTRRPPTQRS